MKLDFTWRDDVYHQYCINCHHETIKRIYEGGKTYYFCLTCNKKSERSIVIDPAINWWIAEDREYWHESSGVFVRRPDGRFLFFERIIFPFALTVPAGHVDKGESSSNTAKRELKEEVGLSKGTLIKVASEDILGDSCRRGSDAHRWHAFLLILNSEVVVKVCEEGVHPVWLTLSEALIKDLTYPVRFMIERHGHKLERRI